MLVAVLAGLVLAGVTAGAQATITPSSNALTVAQAIASPSANVTGASFVAEPGGTPDGVSTNSMAGFPTDGSSFGVLTSGNVNPSSANCLTFDFRFLSVKYPGYVGSTFNDGFVAELDAPITAAGKVVSATEGSTFNGQVATFTDPDTSATSSEYAAPIDWGDGTPTTAGTITGSGGSFSVAGSHVFDDEGSKTVTATIADVDNAANTAIATRSAMIADAALTASGLGLVSLPAYSGPVAAFHDANTTTSSLADFTATIDWGDGTAATSGTVTGSGGSYTVGGGHTYGRLGSFTIQGHIDDDGGSTADATATMLVFAVPAGGSFVIGDGGHPARAPSSLGSAESRVD